MANKYIDLHTHTIYSDGLLTPGELLQKAKDYDLAAISIADHDTTAAYTKETQTIADKLEIELVPGIEFSTRDSTSKYHILGLLIDLKSPNLNYLTDRLKNERIVETHKICQKLKELRWIVDMVRLLNEPGIITKAHICRAVINNPENKDHLVNLFGHMPTEGGFVEAIMIKGKPAFVKNDDALNPQEAIKTIQLAGGLALLAHPSFNILKGEPFDNLCQKFLDLGINGFEAINVQYDRSNGDVEVEHIEQFKKFCRKHNLVISGGSDFHHDNEKMIGKFTDLGFRNDHRKVPYSVLDNLRRVKKITC